MPFFHLKKPLAVAFLLIFQSLRADAADPEYRCVDLMAPFSSSSHPLYSPEQLETLREQGVEQIDLQSGREIVFDPQRIPLQMKKLFGNRGGFRVGDPAGMGMFEMLHATEAVQEHSDGDGSAAQFLDLITQASDSNVDAFQRARAFNRAQRVAGMWTRLTPTERAYYVLPTAEEIEAQRDFRESLNK